MARIQVFQGGNIAPPEATEARYRAADFGPGVGQGVEQLGRAMSEGAQVMDGVAAIHDEAAAKQAATSTTGRIIDAGYKGDGAFFALQGKNALDAAPVFQKNMGDWIKEGEAGLQNDRQKYLYRNAITPQAQSFTKLIGEHSAKETITYGTDQSKARQGTSVDAFTAMHDSDPAAAQDQLHTALGEVAQRGHLLGWSDDQIQSEQDDVTHGAYATVALQKAVADPMGAWQFIDEHQKELGPEKVIALQTSLRPRVLREQGVALADQISGISANPGAVPRDPLAPLPDAQPADAGTVWARMVGPDGKGGIEGGTNADGSFRTSPKGAVGPAQVMPGTAREAAKLAGLAYNEDLYRSDSSYNLALGKAYYQKQLSDFGDPILAAAAYNAGPGRVRQALQKGGADGWTQHLPQETRTYVSAVAGGSGTGAGVGRSSAKTTLAHQLQALDAIDGPQEAKDAAREVLTQRAQTASIIATQDHQDWLNGFEVSLHDGTAGAADIDAARKSGRLTDYDEITRAEGIVKDREKGTEDLTRFGLMMSNPHFQFNPFDDDEKRAVDVGVKKMGGTPDAAFQVWQKTGILATQGAVALRGSLVSTDPRTVQVGANIAGNMLRRNPNAFAGVNGGSEIEQAAVAFNHYLYDLGMDPAAAAQRVAKENDPKFKAQSKYTEPQRIAAMQQLRQNGGAQAMSAFKGAKFADAAQQMEANETYHELIVDQLSAGHDLGSAQSIATQQLKKTYGVNARGVVVKYPPEAGYPAIGGSFDYIYNDAAQTVEQETGHKPEHVRLVPIPGVTDQDFRDGHSPRYRILFSHTVHGQQITDIVPGYFAADVGAATKAASAAHRKQFMEARREAINHAENPSLRDPAMLMGSMH